MSGDKLEAVPDGMASQQSDSKSTAKLCRSSSNAAPKAPKSKRPAGTAARGACAN